MSDTEGDAESRTVKCKQRLKFSNDRRFDSNSDKFIEMERETSEDGGSMPPSEELDFDELVENTNQNACLSEEAIEGEDSSGNESTNDLRKVLDKKHKEAKGKGKLKKPQEGENVGSPKPGCSQEGESQSDDMNIAERNANFENFMVWMDRYKKFQEWESNQANSGKQDTHKVDRAVQSPSESTIYTRMCKSRESMMESENTRNIDLNELVDTSGVLVDGKLTLEGVECSSTASTQDDYANIDINKIDSLILDARKAASEEQASRKRGRQEDEHGPDGKRRRRNDKQTAHTSRSDDDDEDERQMSAERESKERRDKILLDAELQRAQLLKPGKPPSDLSHLFYDAQHISLGSHVDKGTELKIMRGEFVDLHELLPRRKGHRSRPSKPTMRLVNDNGVQKWVEETNDQEITSYLKWEEAFEIYASIYVRGNPGRAQELYDYKFTIRDAASNFVWDNVYDYDIEFRLHMERCKNNRKWSAKLDYEWSRCLKNHLQFRHDKGGAEFHNPVGASSQGAKTREICNRYNKGRCTWGSQCRYLHICKICKKRGHGASIYRSDKNAKVKKEKGAGGESGSAQGM